MLGVMLCTSPKTYKFLTVRRYSLWQGGYSDLRNMGACYPRIPGFLCAVIVFQAYPACFYFGMCHIVIASGHENHEANTTGP